MFLSAQVEAVLKTWQHEVSTVLARATRLISIRVRAEEKNEGGHSNSLQESCLRTSGCYITQEWISSHEDQSGNVVLFKGGSRLSRFEQVQGCWSETTVHTYTVYWLRSSPKPSLTTESRTKSFDTPPLGADGLQELLVDLYPNL